MRPFLFLFALLSAALVLKADELPLTIDQSHSRIFVDVKVPFKAFTAELSDYHLDILTDSENGKILSGQLNFKFSSIKTGDPRRDTEMLTWESDDQFPEVIFTLVSLTSVGDSKYNARGQLLFHGTKKDLTFPVTIVNSINQAYVIDGDYLLDTREFNLPVARRYFILSVDPMIHLFFHLQGSVTKK